MTQSRSTNKQNPKHAGSLGYNRYVHSPKSKWKRLENFSLRISRTQAYLNTCTTIHAIHLPISKHNFCFIATKNTVPGMWSKRNVPAETWPGRWSSSNEMWHIDQPGQFYRVETRCICSDVEEKKNKTVYSSSSDDCCHTELKMYTTADIRGFPYSQFPIPYSLYS